MKQPRHQPHDSVPPWEAAQYQGNGMTHNAIRQAGHYIINGRSTVSLYVSKCVTCRKLRGRM